MELEPSRHLHNSLRLPSIAEWYCEVADHNEIDTAVQFARSRKLPITILGDGSNVVLPERLDGLVVRSVMRETRVTAATAEYVEIRAGAGCNWHQLVVDCLKNGWYGLENLALIPGTVGAAPVQNIGAYGIEIADFIRELEIVDMHSGDDLQLTASECDFSYRNSRFLAAADRDRLLIRAVRLRLYRRPRVDIQYPRLEQALLAAGCDDPQPADVFATVVALREKLPDPTVLPNVGSYFRNPLVDAEKWQRLQKKWSQITGWTQPDGQVKISAGWMLEQLGWRGCRYSNGIKIHDQHAMVLINDRNLKGSDVLECADKMRRDVQEHFEIQLQVEPRVFN